MAPQQRFGPENVSNDVFARCCEQTTFPFLKGRSLVRVKDYTTHAQQLAAAAQVGDAKGIRKKITEMKMRLIKVVKATGRG